MVDLVSEADARGVGNNRSFTASPSGRVETFPSAFRLAQDSSSSIVTFPARGVGSNDDDTLAAMSCTNGGSGKNVVPSHIPERGQS
ncbi:MAG: hypothetical protein EB034_08480 [Verrucomicrobia bacterium]|nr:hypothetical protein [Verrucomicrobiota bacterium]